MMLTRLQAARSQAPSCLQMRQITSLQVGHFTYAALPYATMITDLSFLSPKLLCARPTVASQIFNCFHPNKASQPTVLWNCLLYYNHSSNIDLIQSPLPAKRPFSFFSVRTRSIILKPCSPNQQYLQLLECVSRSRCCRTPSPHACQDWHHLLPPLSKCRVTQLLNTLFCIQTRNTPSHTPRVQTFGAEMQILFSECPVEQSATFKTLSSAPVCLATKDTTNAQSLRARNSFTFSTWITARENKQRCACCPMSQRSQTPTM